MLKIIITFFRSWLNLTAPDSKSTPKPEPEPETDPKPDPEPEIKSNPKLKPRDRFKRNSKTISDYKRLLC